jgi:hypothetical protein
VTPPPQAATGDETRRAPWSSLLRRFLERDPGEVARRAAGFAIAGEGGRRLVARLGEAFINGYNAMLRQGGLRGVREQGERVDTKFRPFFFEGAAMGYLPRGYMVRGCTARSAERDLLEMHPAFRYLYYVGLGFWFGIRHPRRPETLETLRPHIDPLYLPLCYDGFGFKVGFFDFPKNPQARIRLERCPAERRAAAHQGFGRALFFVFMDDERGFRRERDRRPEHRDDIECGRSLALGFTGLDRPTTLADHLAAARGKGELEARLTGIAWALTARDMNDADYLRRCLGAAPRPWDRFLLRLPGLCRQALIESGSYREWQARTRHAASEAHAASGLGAPAPRRSGGAGAQRGSDAGGQSAS